MEGVGSRTSVGVCLRAREVFASEGHGWLFGCLWLRERSCLDECEFGKTHGSWAHWECKWWEDEEVWLLGLGVKNGGSREVRLGLMLSILDEWAWAWFGVGLGFVLGELSLGLGLVWACWF